MLRGAFGHQQGKGFPARVTRGAYGLAGGPVVAKEGCRLTGALKGISKAYRGILG